MGEIRGAEDREYIVEEIAERRNRPVTTTTVAAIPFCAYVAMGIIPSLE